MKIGYARVSTIDQHLSLQYDALTKAGCEQIYSESKSGKNTTDRPEFEKMMGMLRKGDVLVVNDLTRLGRSILDLIKIVTSLKEKGVEFVAIKNSIDTSTTSGRLMFNILASLAEYERENIVERTHAGLAAARERGRVGGRPEGKSVDNRKKAQSLRALVKSGVSINDAAKQLGLGRATGYRWMKEEEV